MLHLFSSRSARVRRDSASSVSSGYLDENGEALAAPSRAISDFSDGSGVLQGPLQAVSSSRSSSNGNLDAMANLLHDANVPFLEMDMSQVEQPYSSAASLSRAVSPGTPVLLYSALPSEPHSEAHSPPGARPLQTLRRQSASDGSNASPVAPFPVGEPALQAPVLISPIVFAQPSAPVAAAHRSPPHPRLGVHPMPQASPRLVSVARVPIVFSQPPSTPTHIRDSRALQAAIATSNERRKAFYSQY